MELSDLHDQNVQDLTLELEGASGGAMKTSVTLQAQWIYNKIKFYENLLQHYETLITQQNVDIEDY